MPRRPGSVTRWPSENWDCAVLFEKAFQPKDRNARQIESITNPLVKSHGGTLRVIDYRDGRSCPLAVAGAVPLVHGIAWSTSISETKVFSFFWWPNICLAPWSSLVMKLLVSIRMEVALLFRLSARGIAQSLLPPKIPAWLWISSLALLVLLFSRL